MNGASMLGRPVAIRRAILYLLVTTFPQADAQDLRDRSLEQEKRALESDRQQQEKQRSKVEAQRPELSSPVEKKRDPKACENARVNYQVSCGSPVAPKYRSPMCRDAEIFLRQNC
jgi:hypothetical protein